MSWLRGRMRPPHEGETCAEVETQLDAALAEINETRAVLRSMFGDRYADETLADSVRMAMGLEPRR